MAAQTPMKRGVPFHVVSAGTSPDAVSVRGAACELLKLWLSNKNAAVRYVKVYDKAAAPVVGTDTPALTFAVPGASTGVAVEINLSPHPEVAGTLLNGLGIGISTGPADSDTGAPSAGDVTVSGIYRS